jgi:hypothetical protein
VILEYFENNTLNTEPNSAHISVMQKPINARSSARSTSTRGLSEKHGRI